MKPAILTLCFLALTLNPRTPVLARGRNYPMQVQVVRTRWRRWRGWYNGFGRANLISQQPGQPPQQGIDFNFGCGEPVRISFGPDTYPARYGKNPLEIVVQLPQPGSNKTKDCTLKVEMKDYVYVRTGHGLAAAPLGGGPPVPLQHGGDRNR